MFGALPERDPTVKKHIFALKTIQFRCFIGAYYYYQLKSPTQLYSFAKK